MTDKGNLVHDLSELEIESVGLVDKAANRRKFLLFKRDGRQTEEVMSENTETPIENLDGVVEQLENVEDVGGLKKALQSIFKWFGGQQKESAPEPEPEEETVEKAVADLREMTKGLQESLEKAEKRAEEAERIATEERDKRVTAEYIAKAEALAIPGKVEDLADVLRKADAAGVGEAVQGVLEAASNAIVQSGIFIEKGTTKTEPVPEDEFLDAVEKRKAELREKDPKLSEADAFSQAYTAIGDEQPELAKAYIDKRERETGRK